MADEVFKSIATKELSVNTINVERLDDLNAASISITTALNIADSKNVVVGTSIGTKIGTATGEKLGFWGVTPIVQPIAATGGAMTVDQLLVILQTTGIVKQS